MGNLFADIIVDIASENLDRTFQYRIPDGLRGQVKVGSVARIPFGNGNRVIRGYVVGISGRNAIEADRIKDILSVEIDPPDAEAHLVALAAAIRRRYGGTMAQALRTVIPVRKKVRQQERKVVVLTAGEAEAERQLAFYKKKNQKARARALEAILEEKELPRELLRDRLGISNEVLRALEDAGMIRVERMVRYRTPDMAETGGAEGGITLTQAQRDVVREITGQMDRYLAASSGTDGRNGPDGEDRPGPDGSAPGEAGGPALGVSDPAPPRFLLHGVTGSGKTAVYIELIAHAVAEGRQAIMLIPEIALTWQTVMRFRRRFGDRVSFIHSRLSAGERYDQFERARKGEIDVMIGPRSALFTPFARPGIIVIDEEQEGAYQSESVPRYHAREAARMRAQMEGAVLVLGSATPSIDAYYLAQKGDYTLLTLPERINQAPLPAACIVDLREELRSGNRSILSMRLQEAMEDRLEKKEQMMLFLNRRGYAGFISCRSCGHVVKCPHCDVSLALHMTGPRTGSLVCHYCGYTQAYTQTCPECGSPFLLPLRAGTQQIEEEVRSLFPEARLLRMDLDTTRQKDSYEKILTAFASHEADILIGTQMIVKGHDFPDVTLVGILAADLSLHVPDFRAGERTFQLITQAAGRAGRADRPGEVIVQTYSPDHYCIRSAAAQDYLSFYEEEIAYRELGLYPPTGYLLSVHLSGGDPDRLEMAADYLGRFARHLAAHASGSGGAAGAAPVQVLGPSDELIAKIQDQYRKILYIKAAGRDLLEDMREKLEAYVEINEGFRGIAIEYEMA